MLTRRDFLMGSIATGSAAAIGCMNAQPGGPAAGPPGPPPPPAPAPVAPEPSAQASTPARKTLLILGGTNFLGPAVVEVALARGYTITLFNRGKTRPDLFPELEKLRGDRDPKKGDGLRALEGRSWDAVLDTSGYYPRIVRASAELLAPNVKRYIFISSVSAYAEHTTPGADETAPVAKLADPTVETMGKEFENYGGLKALCEQAAEAAMPGKVANVRPGYIVGPGDPTDRFTYWPVRAARGGDMLAPGAPEDPIQIIDVRDLGAWLVTLLDRGTTGLFNAVGPAEPLTMGGVLEACKAAAEKAPELTWVSAKFLKEAPGGAVEPPIWAPPEGESLGFHKRSFAKAQQAGLTYRPVPETVKDTLAWFRTLPAERQAKLKAGLDPQREADVLKAWRAQQKKAKLGGAKAKK